MAKKIIDGELCKKEKIKPIFYRKGAKDAEKNLKNSKELLLVSIRFSFRSFDCIRWRMWVAFMAAGRNHQAEKQNQSEDGNYFFIHRLDSRGRVDEPFQVVLGPGW